MLGSMAPDYISFLALLIAGAVFLTGLFVYNHVKKDKE